MGKEYVTVVPIYKEILSPDETGCVKRYEEILTDCDLVFIAPEDMKLDWYQKHFPKFQYRLFAPKYFKGPKTYNKLMLNVKFYESFGEYDYLLIAQTDAVIWQDENRIREFMETGYDYIGAPWIPERRIWEWTFPKIQKFPGFAIRCCKKKGQGIVMGNGGFCLRNIPKTISLIQEFSWRKSYWFWKRNEDIFFGVFGRENQCGYRLADVNTGKAFAREYGLRECVKEKNIPFAVHGWQKEFSDFEEMVGFLQEHGYFGGGNEGKEKSLN